MATILSNVINESLDGSSFNIRDNTTGWGETYAKSNITAAVIAISSPELEEDITLTMTSSQLFSFFTNDGLDITADELGIGAYFTDGYYEIKLTLTLDVAPSTDYYINKKGFLQEHRNRVIDMCEDLEYPVDDYSKHNDKIIASLLLESAQAAADKGDDTTFQYIINKVNAVFSNYQLDELW